MLNLSPLQTRAYETDGFVHGGTLLSPSEVDALRAELDRVVAQHDRGHATQVFIDGTAAFVQQRPDFLQVTNIRELSPLFRDLVMRPDLIATAARMLGSDDLRIFADTILCKNAKNNAVNSWHRDGPAFEILRPPSIFAAWIALDDVGPDDGAVCFARGSHLWKENHGEALDKLEPLMQQHLRGEDGGAIYRSVIRRGEVHFHHGLTWHCSLENKTGKSRRAFVINFIPASVRYHAAGGSFFKGFVTSRDGEPLEGPHFPRVLTPSPSGVPAASGRGQG